MSQLLVLLPISQASHMPDSGTCAPPANQADWNVRKGRAMHYERKIVDKALGISSLIVIPLSIQYYFNYSDVSIYFLFPGLIPATLITGGHGGTYLEEVIAAAVSIVVNICAYTLVCLFGVSLYRGWRRH